MIELEEFEVPPEDYFRLLFRHWMKQSLWLHLSLTVCAGSLYLIEGPSRFVLFLLGTWAMFVLVYFVAALCNAFSGANAAFCQEKKMVFDTGRYRVVTPDGSETEGPMTDFVRANVLCGYYRLFSDELTFIPVPFTAFRSEQDRRRFEREVLGERLGGNFPREKALAFLFLSMFFCGTVFYYRYLDVDNLAEKKVPKGEVEEETVEYGTPFELRRWFGGRHGSHGKTARKKTKEEKEARPLPGKLTGSISFHRPETEHPLLDYDRCVELFAPLRTDLRGETVASPFDLFAVQTLRGRYRFEGCPSRPVDVFVWAKGEPEKRYLSAIGGIPFLPATRTWPKDIYGEPRVFIGQISFVDSRDILGFPIPGDVLMIFSDRECWDGYHLMCGYSTSLHFEWADKDMIPWSRERFRQDRHPCIDTCMYGVIHRSRDYMPDEATTERIESDDLDDTVPQAYLVPSFSGTKIAGFPHFINSGPPDFDDRDLTWEDARYLGQLASIQAIPDTPYPWCNRETPSESDPAVENSIFDHQNTFLIGDAGDIYFFLDRDGQVKWLIESYNMHYRDHYYVTN